MLWLSGAHLHHGNSLIVRRPHDQKFSRLGGNRKPPMMFLEKRSKIEGSLDGGSLASLSGKNLASTCLRLLQPFLQPASPLLSDFPVLPAS